MFNNNDESKLNSQIMDLTIKTNSCYCKLNELIHRLNEIESKINIILTKNLKPLSFEAFSIYGMQKELNEISSKKVALGSYTITYIAEQAGFLDIECDKSQIIINNVSEISIKNSLKNFYVRKYDVIEIRNPVNLKNVSFRKIGK